MPAATYDIYIERGATFRSTITWKDSTGALVNLTGYTARMQVRQKLASTTALISLVDGAGITLGGAAGTIVIEITDTVTTALDIRQGVYDLELVSGGGIVTRLIEGGVGVSKEVTRV